VANLLGLAGFLVFIVCVIGLAAGATWLVVRVSPVPGSKPPKPQSTADTDAAP
jgi:hypothetical protein